MPLSRPETARSTQPSPRKGLLADAILVLVCLVWGSTFVVVKEAVAELPTMTFLTLRFLLALVVLGIVFRRDLCSSWRRLARPGLWVGLWLGGGYAFQTLGLQYTQASRAGFITGLAVVLVPLLSALVYRERPASRSWAGVGLALLGLVFLFVIPGAAGTSGAVSAAGAATAQAAAPSRRLLGDLLVLGCTVCFGLHIVTLGRYSSTQVKTYGEAGALTTIQVGVATLGYGLGCLVQAVRGGGLAALLPAGASAGHPFSGATAGAIVLTGLLATAGAFLAQTAAQRHTTPTHTALIFASEPVFAALFGWLILGERLGPWGTAGCALILSGMIVAEMPRSRRLRPAGPAGTMSGGEGLPADHR